MVDESEFEAPVKKKRRRKKKKKPELYKGGVTAQMPPVESVVVSPFAEDIPGLQELEDEGLEAMAVLGASEFVAPPVVDSTLDVHESALEQVKQVARGVEQMEFGTLGPERIDSSMVGERIRIVLYNDTDFDWLPGEHRIGLYWVRGTRWRCEGSGLSSLDVRQPIPRKTLRPVFMRVPVLPSQETPDGLVVAVLQIGVGWTNLLWMPFRG